MFVHYYSTRRRPDPSHDSFLHSWNRRLGPVYSSPSDQQCIIINWVAQAHFVKTLSISRAECQCHYANVYLCVTTYKRMFKWTLLVFQTFRYILVFKYSTCTHRLCDDLVDSPPEPLLPYGL